MKSARRGSNTSAVEVTNVSSRGFWLLLDSEELFVPFSSFPWFREAAKSKLARIERPHPTHLYWPELDVDLAVESIRDPKKLPLVAKSKS